MSTPSFPAPGLHAGVKMADYLALEAASSSRLATILSHSPAHMRAELEQPRNQTPALVLGEAIHAAILQPDLFEARFVAAPEVDRRTKEGKQVYAEFLAANLGKAILTAEQWRIALNVRDSVWNHPTASTLLGGLDQDQIEVTAIWNDPDLGVLCKARPDALAEAFGAMIDVKTTEHAGPYAFPRAIFRYHYHLQSAFHGRGLQIHGWPLKDHVIIAAEKDPPWAVAVYRLTDDAVDAGLRQARTALEIYARCMESGEWPAYPVEVQDVSLPQWAWQQIDEQIGPKLSTADEIYQEALRAVGL